MSCNHRVIVVVACRLVLKDVACRLVLDWVVLVFRGDDGYYRVDDNDGDHGDDDLGHMDVEDGGDVLDKDKWGERFVMDIRNFSLDIRVDNN
tara:strand:- start:281 stop:556 length:276 start_codon:yes stop_codon:yes gene_type:complete